VRSVSARVRALSLTHIPSSAVRRAICGTGEDARELAGETDRLPLSAPRFMVDVGGCLRATVVCKRTPLQRWSVFENVVVRRHLARQQSARFGKMRAYIIHFPTSLPFCFVTGFRVRQKPSTTATGVGYCIDQCHGSRMI
jgi:hypothetical protein